MRPSAKVITDSLYEVGCIGIDWYQNAGASIPPKTLEQDPLLLALPLPYFPSLSCPFLPPILEVGTL